MFADAALNEETLFLIANKLYAPSYISFEMALSYYGLIPEGVYSITSATSKKTAKFKTQIAEFFYHNLKPQLIFGYNLRRVGGRQYKFAEMEKAVLDYLYLNPKCTRKADLEEWRFEAAEFLTRADLNKFNKYLKIYGSPSMERRAQQFINFIRQR
jgi:predicted transcriptional regulator of viral defense system